MISNYEIIFRHCLKGKGELAKITEQCYDNSDCEFKEFLNVLNKQNIKIKNMWASDTLSGFITLVEGFIVKLDNSIQKPSETTKVR